MRYNPEEYSNGRWNGRCFAQSDGDPNLLNANRNDDGRWLQRGLGQPRQQVERQQWVRVRRFARYFISLPQRGVFIFGSEAAGIYFYRLPVNQMKKCRVSAIFYFFAALSYGDRIRMRFAGGLEEIASAENLLEAWREFLPGKRAKHDVEGYSNSPYWSDIFSLHADLVAGNLTATAVMVAFSRSPIRNPATSTRRRCATGWYIMRSIQSFAHFLTGLLSRIHIHAAWKRERTKHLSVFVRSHGGRDGTTRGRCGF